MADQPPTIESRLHQVRNRLNDQWRESIELMNEMKTIVQMYNEVYMNGNVHNDNIDDIIQDNTVSITTDDDSDSIALQYENQDIEE